MYKISDDNFIDTRLESNIKKYNDNLNELVSKLGDGELNISIIRNEEELPSDFVWRVNSKYTKGEYNTGNIGFVIREELAIRKVIGNSKIPVPQKKKEVQEEMLRIDQKIGSVYLPARFRSTKHFTVNTPLSYTGNYNAVRANRKFTVIDGANNFLNSGYGYSMADHDAYLDVTHEGLKIGEDAVILVNEKEYNKLKNNPIFEGRRLVAYRGELNAAINMILSERGCLPFKPGMSYGYTNETQDKIETLLKDKCNQYGLLYDQSHSSFYGNGHFSDLIDRNNYDYYKAFNEFCAFMNSKFPGVNFNGINNREICYDILDKVDVHDLIKAIKEFNSYSEKRIEQTHDYYVSDRESITPEISNLFKSTLNKIKNYAYTNQNNFSDYLWENIEGFFYSGSVSEQVSYAREINEILDAEREIRRR